MGTFFCVRMLTLLLLYHSDVEGVRHPVEENAQVQAPDRGGNRFYILVQFSLQALSVSLSQRFLPQGVFMDLITRGHLDLSSADRYLCISI